MSELYTEFVKNLKNYFGKYDEENHRFENMSNSEIARELGYSDAQFSRLINSTATEGEYQRANQNLERLIYIRELESELSISKTGLYLRKKKRFWISLLFLMLIFCSAFYLIFSYYHKDSHIEKNVVNRDYTLKWAFENSYIKPYTKLNSLPEDCNFPCYKYQGQWALKKPYKLPFFREQNGYHYLATDVSMYARCDTELTDDGSIFEGYEYQRHEIWYDTEERPVDSFILDNGELSKDYMELNLPAENGFVKVAIVHTLFKNTFEIKDSLIHRTGKVIGRDVEIVKDDQLKQAKLADQIIRNIKSEVNNIARVRLEDFSRPISCIDAQAPNSDYNLVKDGDELSFKCELTTSRLALNYSKTYVLMDQYIKNTCRPAE